MAQDGMLKNPLQGQVSTAQGGVRPPDAVGDIKAKLQKLQAMSPQELDMLAEQLAAMGVPPPGGLPDMASMMQMMQGQGQGGPGGG